MKKYFAPVFDEVFCYSKDTIIDMMKSNNLIEITVYVAVPMYSNDLFWCKVYAECCEKGSSCGKQCCHYNPKNGKSGCCKYVGKLFERGEEITIKLNNKQ